MMQFRIIDYNYAYDSAVVVTASSEDPSFPASNIKKSFRSKVWRSAPGVTTANVVFDIGSTEAVDSVVFLWDAMRGFPLSTGATVRIQANATNTWTSPSLNQLITIDYTFDAASYFFNSDQNYRYWRVLVSDPTNPNGYVELSSVIFGKATQFSTLPQVGFQYTIIDQSKIIETDYGQSYADLYPMRRKLSISLNCLSYTDLRLLEDIYRRVGRSTPIVVSIDPLGDTYDPEHFLIYGKFDDALSVTQVSILKFAHSISITETF